MKCTVCGRRMRSGLKCFECDGCGGTAAFVPIAEVLSKLEGSVEPELTDAEVAEAMGRLDAAVEKSKKKVSKKKGTKK